MNRKYCERWLKSCLKKKVSITATTIIMFLMTGLVVSTPIYASVLIGATENDTATATRIKNQDSTVSSWGITIGGAISKAGDKSVHVGDATGSVGSRNVVIGTYASAGYDAKKPADNPEKDGAFNQSVAIGAGGAAGEGARAYGDQSIAIGSNTIARGNSSIAIGNDDVDKTDKINTTYTDNDGNRVTATIGTAYNQLTGKNLVTDGGQYADTTAGEAAVAVGVKSEAGDISLALGTAAKAKVVNGVAIGSGATANRDNAVAIGGGSTTDAEGTKETKITVNGLTFKWAGGDRTVSGDVVSFGKDQYERQLKHVAPGKVSAESTDAINGSQLHGVLSHLTEDPVFMFAADDSSESNVVGDTPEKKQEDSKSKNIVARSIKDSRLNILGGATGALSDKNISVKYADEKTLKIKLAKNLTELESAEFKNTAGDKTVINGNGVTITPVTAGKEQVSLTKDGLNNGGNQIANVGGNLVGAKTGTTVPTTKAAAPNDVDGIKNNAATVGDVLQSGWNLQGNGEEKDFVKPYDTVNFANGDGTTVVVETKGNKVSTIKYNVNTGGIEAGTTPGTMKVTDGDTGKIATVDSVVNAVNNAAFTLKASAGDGTRNGNSTVNANGEAIKAGNTIEMIAGKNLEVKHDKNGKITFATVDNPSFSTVQIGDSEGPKFSATSDGNIRVSDKDDTKPVKITNVKDGEISKISKDAINGSQFHKLANNTIKLAGQNGEEKATETNAQTLNQQNGIKFTVKSSDGELLEVTASGDTITLKPKTATITTDTDGVPTATTTNGKLVTADDLITTLKGMGWKAVAGKDGTGTVTGAASELIKAGETVTFKAGDNLKIKQDGKNFIYSLNTALSGLTSAEFKDANNNKVNITPTGIIITKPENTDNNEPEKTVTLNQDGLNNGGNLITNVASNLQGAKAGTTAPTTKAAAPDDVVGIKNNAATVGDVLNAGWNLQGNGEEKDFVQPYDTVNFINGDGTTATVETTNNKVSTVKYSVNLGNGLKKDDTGNTISIKPADKSLEVNKDGVKVKTDGTTITTDDNKGLKVVTGAIESVTTGNDSGTVKVKEGDTGKIATVDSVVNAVNSAAFTLKASATTGGTRNGSSSVGENGEDIKAGKTIEMIAGKNLNVTHNENGKIIFATVDTPTFSTVQVGGDQGPKFSKTSDGDIKVSDKDGANPVKVTNVKDGAVTENSKDAINGSQFHKVAKNTIKLAGQNGTDTATETNGQDLDKTGGIKFTVKSSDGKLLDVVAAGDTITLTPKTATLTSTNGVPQADTTNGKLITADDLITTLKGMGWKATADKDGTGTVEGNAAELIKAGETVTFKAGNNLKIKQSAKEFIYSLNPELTGLTSAEFKDAAGNTSKLDGTGLTITPKDTTKNPVSITKDGIKAGDKAITNVASNLTNYDSGNKDGLVNLSKIDTTPNSNVATVGDLRNMGWVVSSDKTTGALGTAYNDKVKNADEVKFVGTGAATVSGKTDNKGVRTITVDVTVPDVEKGTINAATTEADKGKVVANKGDGDKFTTVDTVVNAINSAAWKVTSDKEGTGNTATIGHTQSKEEIKAGDTVTFKAGDNLIIKQSGKEFTYSLNPELTNLSKVEVKDTAGNSVVTTPTGTTITGKDTTDPTKDITTVINAGGTTVTDKDGNTTKVDGNGITITSKNDPANPVKLTKDGLDNGRNTITNVKSNLPEETNDNKLKQDKPNNINNNNAATVGDVLNAGWNLQNNGTDKDFVRPYDTVNFINGDGTTATVETTDNKVSKIKYDVNTGNGLEKTTDNKIAIKAADASLVVDANGVKVNTGTINNVTTGDKTGTVEANTGDANKIATVGNVTEAINNAAWTATAAATTAGELGKPATNQLVKAGDKVTFEADKNIKITQNGSKFTFATKENVAFETVQVGGDQGPKLSKTDAGDLKVSGSNGTDPVKVTNVKSGLDKYGDQVNNADVPGTTDKNRGLVDLSKPTTGEPKVSDNTAATVGDLRNMGWIVSAEKTTNDLTNAYSATVKNANEVKFVGKGTAKVSGKTEGNVRTITVEVNDQVSTNNSVTPVVYTKADGTQVYPIKQADGTTKFNTKPDGTGTEVPATDVITSVNGPKGTTKPTILSNVEGNLDGAKTGTTAPTDKHDAPNTTDATQPNYVNTHNAATVGDVLNAGWNLQGNGKAVDFVKPYDTVNFVDGIGTTVEAKVDEKGTTSTIKINTVMQYTDKEGNPVKKAENGKYYKESDLVGKVYDKATNTFKNENGTPLAEQPKAVKNPQVNIVNAEPDTANNKTATTTPSQLGNVANGAGVYNDKVDDKGNPLTEVDGKYYKADQFENGKLKENAAETTPNAANSNKFKGLSNLTNAPDSNVATVGDIKNLGWVVSSDKTTGDLGKDYNDQVRNANEVKFVGKNGIQVSGKTDDKGVRTLTFEMEAGEVTPTEIVKIDDNTKLVKVGDKAYKPEDIAPNGQPKDGVTPVGTVAKDGNVYATDSVIDSNGNVYPAGTTLTDGVAPAGTAKATPIATNKPNNGSKFVTGNQVADAIEKSGFVVGKNNKALSAADFKNKDERVNPNDELRFADGDNTNVKLATKEVLDASGKVKTVTTVKVDVVDLPVKYTDKDGNIVKKGEDGKYYKASDLADKVYINGKYYPANSVVDKNGKVYPAGTTLTNGLAPTGTQEAPESSLEVVAAPKTNLVNPNAGENKAGDPTQLGNVANGADTFKPVKDPAGNDLKLANDGKWYLASQVDANGKPKENATPVANPLAPKNANGDVLAKGNDGKWYKESDLTDGKPNAGAPEQTLAPKADNADKAGLVDFNNSKPTNAATVGDLQNMGWVVGTPDNSYNDQVRNANKVDFKGGNGIVVTGKTTANGTREITVGIKEGIVTNDVKVTKEDGRVIEAIRDKDGKLYEKDANGKADKTKPVEITDKDKVENNGSGFVTGNTVATAIGESGWNVGKANAKDVTKAFETEAKLHDKVNPNDDVKFVDGDNTTVSMVTIDSKDENGTKKTTTYIKTDINKDIHIDSVTTGGKITNEAGDPMMLGKDGNYYPAGSVENNGNYYPAGSIVNNGNVYPAGSVVSKNGNVYPAGTTLDKNGNPTTAGITPVSPITTPLTPTAVTDVKVAPKTELTEDGIKMTPAKPLKKDEVDPKKVVNLTNKGLNNGGNNITNVKSNLPQVKDGDKKAYDVDGNPIANKNNTAAPITAADAADLLNPTKDGKSNPNYAGNNAATVGDVLNAGWNLQNNGTAKDFVKPYDTVNFVDGGNTRAVVTTDKDGTTSNVTYNVTGLPMSYTDKDGKPVSKVGDNYYTVDNAGNVIDANGNPAAGKNKNGDYVDTKGNVIKPIDRSANPLTINLVNPNVSADKSMTTPMRIGNIESGAKTFEAKVDKNGNPLIKVGTDYYTADQLDKNGQPKAGEAPKTDIQDIKMSKDGKWYPADSVLINNKYYPAGSVVSKNGNVYPAGTTLDKDGNPTTEGIKPVTEVKPVTPKNSGKAGLVDFSSSNSTNAATVGDLQNMGWVVSTSDTGYNDQVRNTNVVDFKEGEGIKISGETLENGVRQIKVGIDKNVVATKQELSQVARLSSAGIAGVAAMANIPQINEAASNRYNIAVGVGYHKGEKALAVGISGVSDGGRVVYKASAAMDSQRQTTVGLGVGYQFGKRDIEPNELDRFRAQLDLVNTQKSSLAQKLKEETHKVKELNNKVEELEKQNKMLNEKMDLILKKLGGK